MIGDNHFIFVAPMFDAEATLPQMLYSLYGQSYPNWHLILIDDMSDLAQVAAAEDVLMGFEQLSAGKVTAIWNTEKLWEVANVLKGIALCKDDDIVCRIDADDSLCDLDALWMINQAYNQLKCDALWTMHRWGKSDRNISGPLPMGADVYRHAWTASHLKTFRKRLINGIPYENFTNMNGDLVRRCGDQAIYLPVLHRATNRVFLPRTMYSYSIDEQGGAVYQTDDAKFQKEEANFIRARGYVSTGIPWEQHDTFVRRAST